MRAILYKNTSDNRVLNKSITLLKEVDIELKDDNNVVSPIIKMMILTIFGVNVMMIIIQGRF